MSHDFKIEKIEAFGREAFVWYRPNTADTAVMSEVLHQADGGHYNLTKFDWWPRVKIPDAPLVIDAGAHIGVASIFFSMMLPGCHVIALEPDEVNYAMLLRNAGAFLQSHITPMHAALGGSGGVAKVVDPDKGTWGYRIERAQSLAPGNVPIRTINALSVFTPPFIVKLDIEGSEIDVFSANLEWIDRTSFIIAELHEWIVPGCEKAWNDAMRDRGRHEIGHNNITISVRGDVWSDLCRES